MNPVIDAAQRDVTIGWLTGAFLTLLRAVALVGFIVATGSRDWLLGGQLAVQVVLAALFSLGVRQRRPSAAIALAVLYGLGYFYSWWLSGRLLPPLALIGVLLWYGLYSGIRGTRAFAATPDRVREACGAGAS